MPFSLSPEESKNKNDRLKVIFHEIEGTSDRKQYALLLEAADLAFCLNETSESLSYFLQAGLIENSYEVSLGLFFLHASLKKWDESKKFLLQAKKNYYSELDYFSFDKWESWMNKEECPKDILLLLDEIISPIVLPKDSSHISFQEILEQTPLHAAEIFEKLKEESGLASKYPELSKLSIHKWEAEFPHRKEKIKEAENLKQKHICLEYDDFIKLGKMYLLENEFEKAAECFTSAKDIYLSTLS